MAENRNDDSLERTRARAQTYVYERLALISAVIWSLGALFMMITFVPYVARPQPYIMVASIVPLFPAALPWLFFRPITSAVMRRWASQAESSKSP